jgi:subtilisin family serine protease
MRKSLLFLVTGLMATTGLFAQSNNNADDVKKIDQHAARQYREGEMIVKFKPSSNVNMRAPMRGATPGMSNIANVMDELGITDSEQLMPLSGAVVSPQTKSLTSVDGKTIEDSDMSSLYKLTFDATKVNVQEAIDKVSALEEVEYAEPNYIIYTLSTGEETGASVTAQEAATYQAEPLFPEQWGHGPLKMPYLWQQPKTTTKRPVIAILDTGVDITHPDLADNIWTNEQEANGAEGEDDDANGFADDLHGWDFVNQTARIGDWNGHGTHCAGIAAAVGNNGIGIAGANPDALIMPITVMQSDGTGDVATIIKGIDYAAANGADVISMSIGGYGYSIAEEQALAKAYSKAVLVAAAGNDFKCIYAHDCPINKKSAFYNGPMFPAAFTFVLGVEASNPDGSLTGFSNFDEDGPVFSKYGEEQLYNYELRAPGASIMSTYPGGRYKKLNGTSMACPFVAGGISRLLQSKEYASWEILFGDLIHTRKQNGYGNVDFEAAYKLTDEDRIPELGLVTYVLKDTIDGDADGRADAGETIALYPTLRNEWGVAQNITISLEVAENEDPTIVEILDSNMSFGKPLSSYAKAKSANALRFKVNENCVDGRHIRLVLRASCDNIAQELIQEFTITAENGVELGGLIFEDTTLYPDVHYIVTNNLAVMEGVTLTILPGTILKFKEGTGISVQGNLEAHGTPDKMIIFTKADNSTGDISGFVGGNYSYCVFRDFSTSDRLFAQNPCITNCIIKFNRMYHLLDQDETIFLRNLIVSNNVGNLTNTESFKNTCYYNNIICNKADFYGGNEDFHIAGLRGNHSERQSNVFNNLANGILKNYISFSMNPVVFNAPIYWGSNREDFIRTGIWDINTGHYFAHYDLRTRLEKPTPEAHAIVWKVVVNGYDAQDEFEQLPPLGVGKHKFEVYFNRPMDTSFTPTVSMGVRPPYTQNAIAEDGSWNDDRTIYTAYMTITGKTQTDGLNRIYVADAVESCDYYYISKELETMFNKISALSENIINFPYEVELQSDDPSKDGYLSFNGQTAGCQKLYDNEPGTYLGVADNGYIQVDLGENKTTDTIRFNYTNSGWWYGIYISSITVQGSKNGVDFNNITTFSSSDTSNPLPTSFGSEWSSPAIVSEDYYRYYRFVFDHNDEGSTYYLAEFGMKVCCAIVKKGYESILSVDEAIEIQRNIAFADSLIMYESHNSLILQKSLDQMYDDYNKLANILGEPILEQTPIDVPSAPEWVIPVENMRFNVEVAAAGSMATGLMAEAGLGKVSLTWETDEEDFEDLLGYNIIRYTDQVDSIYVEWDENGYWVGQWKVVGDTTVINPTVIDSEETSFVDYDVVPGTTYYYVIKQLTTSLSSHALSNAVAATPLTAQKGDANGSMNVDIADVVTEVAYITYQDPQPFIFEAADVNSDTKVNVLDVVGTIGIITTPTGTGISGLYDEPVRYFVQDGILYVETEQPLGGVQVRLNVANGTEIVALDALSGMEQTGVWTAENEYLFLAYSMSGRTLSAGRHALLQIGDDAVVKEIVISDAKGKNITAINANTTGVGVVEAMQLQIPSPNPFTTVLNVPYVIGKEGNHNVTITFCDMVGRIIDSYSTVNSRGEYTYVWYPEALQDGIYMVSLYVDGVLMQTAKVICNN